MSQTPRPLIIAGNWKMYKTIDESIGYIKNLLKTLDGTASRIFLAVPFTVIKTAADLCKGTPVVVGAQNMNDAAEGAFTGEIAGRMLKEAGAQFVILGHSERRTAFGETDLVINRKVKRALADGLIPLLCIGETAAERSAGQTELVLTRQLEADLAGIDAIAENSLILAYEPVWAIGSNHAATPEIAQTAHALCRRFLEGKFGQEIAQRISILYGGSAKPENACALLEQPDIDGLLVGSASLDPESFSLIAQIETTKTLKL